MARPKKDEGKARDHLMQVRLQVREYDEFKKAADSAGLDLSSWVRERLRMAARKESAVDRRQ
jgi:hypothetical protein